MRVSELIRELKKYPGKREVYISIRQQDGSLGCAEVTDTMDLLVSDNTDKEPVESVLLL